MATPQEKLYEALQDGGTVIIHSANLSRLHRERLLSNAQVD